MTEFSTRVKNFPIRVLLGFLLITELLFFVAPQQWQVDNYICVALYLALMNVALCVGYARGVKSHRMLFSQDKVDLQVVKWLIVIALPMMMVQLYWAFGTLNITMGFRDGLLGLYMVKTAEDFLGTYDGIASGKAN